MIGTARLRSAPGRSGPEPDGPRSREGARGRGSTPSAAGRAVRRRRGYCWNGTRHQGERSGPQLDSPESAKAFKVAGPKNWDNPRRPRGESPREVRNVRGARLQDSREPAVTWGLWSCGPKTEKPRGVGAAKAHLPKLLSEITHLPASDPSMEGDLFHYPDGGQRTQVVTGRNTSRQVMTWQHESTADVFGPAWRVGRPRNRRAAWCARARLQHLRQRAVR